MSGYTPLFGSMLDGTLHGKWPHNGVWALLLSMQDRYGCIDKTPQAISSAIGLPVNDLIEIIRELCEPDPYSRSQELEGRRLVLIDPARSWGWRVVNHLKYREKARKSSYEEGRPRNPAKSRDLPLESATPREIPLSDSDSDSYKEKNKSKSARKRAPRARRRLPDEFEPDEAYALERLPGVDLAALCQQFKDHHTAKATVSADWQASWRTWVTRAQLPSYGYPTIAKTNGGWNPDRDLRLNSDREFSVYESARKQGVRFNSMSEWELYLSGH